MNFGLELPYRVPYQFYSILSFQFRLACSPPLLNVSEYKQVFQHVDQRSLLDQCWGLRTYQLTAFTSRCCSSPEPHSNHLRKSKHCYFACLLNEITNFKHTYRDLFIYQSNLKIVGGNSNSCEFIQYLKVQGTHSVESGLAIYTFMLTKS